MERKRLAPFRRHFVRQQIRADACCGLVAKIAIFLECLRYDAFEF